MPLTGQERHFADQIDGLLDRVTRIEKFLGGRWKIADATNDHVHHFTVPIGPSQWIKGVMADAVCRCGAEIIDPKRIPPDQLSDG